MSTDGWVLVQYRGGSPYPTVIGATVHNDLSNAETEAREKRLDAAAARRTARIAVARLEVLR